MPPGGWNPTLNLTSAQNSHPPTAHQVSTLGISQIVTNHHPRRRHHYHRHAIMAIIHNSGESASFSARSDVIRPVDYTKISNNTIRNIKKFQKYVSCIQPTRYIQLDLYSELCRICVLF
jgi:hypothetical protein